MILLLLLNFFIYSQTWVEFSNKSDEFLKQRNFEEAMKYSQMAMDDVIRIYGAETEYHATQLGKMGRVCFFSGNFEKSIELYEKEREIIIKTKGKNNPSYAKCLNNLYVSYSTVGKSSSTENLLIESIEIKRATGNLLDTSLAKSLNNLGQLYQTKGNFPDAEKNLKEALNIKIKVLGEENSSTGISYLNLGILDIAIGNKEEAQKNLEKAYSILKKSLNPTHPDLTNAIYQLATLYAVLDKKELAVKLLNEVKSANKLKPEEINFETANSLYSLAQLKIRLGKVAEAKELLEPHINNIKTKIGTGNPLYAKIINILGISYWQLGELNKAELFLEENNFINLASYGENSIQYASSLHTFAGLLKELKDFIRADEFYKKSFEIYLYQIQNYFPYYSEDEKTKFYRMIKERFEMFNSYILSRSIDNPALIGDMLNYHIATKGLLLDYSKNISKYVLSSNDEELIGKYNVWISKKEQLSELYNMGIAKLKQIGLSIDSIENFTNNLEKDISLKLSKIHPESYELQDWKKIQSKLKPNEAAIEVIRFRFFGKNWNDSTFYAILFLTTETVNNPELLILDNGNLLDGMYLKRYKKNVKAKFPDSKSYDFFWKEIEAKIKDKDRIYFSADGVYNLINVGSLQKDDGTFNLDHKTFIHLNNIKELLYPKNINDFSGDIGLFGNPDYKIEENIKNAEPNGKKEMRIAPLPGTAVEIDKISKIANANNIKADIFLKTNASEYNFKKLETHKIIHIATHGYFLSDISELDGERVFGIDVSKAIQNPLLRAGLLLAGASDFINYDINKESLDNGVLTAYEIKNMDFRKTELVVMSACETGLGEVMNGEGVYGLQRAFQIAGANSIIMSLWTVDDKTTQELMVEFYNLYLSGTELVEAFRMARLKIHEKYKDPYYWGAFKLLGGI